MRIGLVSLGCSKNRVDSELILGALKAAGATVTPDPATADVIVVNTCGFIEPAKQESINTVLEMAQYKERGSCKMLVMSGCLSQRYMSELKEAMPEVDLFWGVKNQTGLAAEIMQHFGINGCTMTGARLLTTPPHYAYLRIADGCDNRCTYCAIPLIRGGRVSVPMDELVSEAKGLAARGVRELIVIAQDTSAYGMDIYGRPACAELLSRLSDISGLDFIRLLYTYPDTVDEHLIDTIVQRENICNYIDMPIQHISNELLARMNRRGTGEYIRGIMDYIRAASDDFIIRSTVITGFPGETEAQHRELLEFLSEHPFDRLGAFAYSAEDNTPASEMPDQIPEDVKKRRLDELMRRQSGISLKLNKKRIGREYTVIVDESANGSATGRSYAEAPEVDGVIRFTPKQHIVAGDTARVRITAADEYDLEGVQL